MNLSSARQCEAVENDVTHLFVVSTSVNTGVLPQGRISASDHDDERLNKVL